MTSERSASSAGRLGPDIETGINTTWMTSLGSY
ncbi:hypothetical protein JOF53_003678 [Crossiella equi]|uniref:Uncharacterized protein n=1 Tax=Crossiella equi TaxID=130796 RepID=A0ABS5ADY7_9PSEU|nr:hypothetical protein [Crossiella equi]